MMTRDKKVVRGRRRGIHFPRYSLRKVVYKINPSSIMIQDVLQHY